MDLSFLLERKKNVNWKPKWKELSFLNSRWSLLVAVSQKLTDLSFLLYYRLLATDIRLDCNIIKDPKKNIHTVMIEFRCIARLASLIINVSETTHCMLLFISCLNFYEHKNHQKCSDSIFSTETNFFLIKLLFFVNRYLHVDKSGLFWIERT